MDSKGAVARFAVYDLLSILSGKLVIFADGKFFLEGHPTVAITAKQLQRVYDKGLLTVINEEWTDYILQTALLQDLGAAEVNTAIDSTTEVEENNWMNTPEPITEFVEEHSTPDFEVVSSPKSYMDGWEELDLLGTAPMVDITTELNLDQNYRKQENISMPQPSKEQRVYTRNMFSHFQVGTSRTDVEKIPGWRKETNMEMRGENLFRIDTYIWESSDGGYYSVTTEIGAVVNVNDNLRF